MYYVLTVKISSDSGVGPYTETRSICNCVFKNGDWYCHKADKVVTVEEKFHTSSADYECKVLKFKKQKRWYYY